jgi:hypothetical protein
MASLQQLRGSAIGSTPAFGAGYPGSSPGPGAILHFFANQGKTPLVRILPGRACQGER